MKPAGLLYTQLLNTELRAVHTTMLDALVNVPPIVATAIGSLINGGGKRLRPALALLSAHLFGADIERAIPVAAAVEMLHTATLIHDDLIDNALIRRGTETLNANWTPAATVLAGDVAFAWSAKMATRSANLELVQTFSETLEIICNGELNQMFSGRGSVPTELAYYDRIFAKTASLFALATRTGPILAQRPDEEAQRMAHFGRRLGEAFQIVDDVLDFMSDEATLGKPVGGDLRQGLATLPVLYYARQHPDDARLPAALARTADEATIQALIADLRRSDAAELAMQTATAHVDEAQRMLAGYPPTPYRQALEEIAAFTVQRRY